MIRITAGPYQFKAKLETELAPMTCAQFQKLLPFKQRLIQARWSGESAWIPLGEKNFSVTLENETSHPAPGQLLFYPADISQTEILFPYGRTIFACRSGRLAGTPFLTIVEGKENLEKLGELVLWNGAQEIVFEHAE